MLTILDFAYGRLYLTDVRFGQKLHFPGKEHEMAEPRTARSSDVIPANKYIIGGKVVNPQDESIGKIEDIVIDATAGRIAYAVLSFGGFLGVGNKYFAIPWNAFRFNLADKKAVLNLDKKLLENAPGFDKDAWPNFSDATFGSTIYRHYGYTPYWEETGTTRTSSL